MNVLILDQFSSPGGAQQTLLDLLPAMSDHGWRALVALPGAGELFGRLRDMGFATERIACGPFCSGRKSVTDAARFVAQLPLLIRSIRRMAERIRADVLYVNGPRLLPALPSGWPVVFHAHSYLSPGAAHHAAGRALARVAAHVIANCRFVAGSWRGYVPPGRVSVIYNGVAGPDQPAPCRAERRRPVAACIGRIAPEKGQLEFLAAAEMIHQACPEVRFEVIGAPLFSEPAAARYAAAVRSAADGLPVDFRGWVKDVYGVLAGIDLLLVPSAAYEATTRVILEAYAAGVPVVALRSGGVPEVVEDGITGLLAGSVPEMAACAIKALRDAGVRRSLAGAGHRRWQTRFNLERFRRQTLAALESAAASGTFPPPPARAEPRPQASSRSRTA